MADGYSFYRLYGDTAAEEYVRPVHKLYQQLERGCARSEFQFLNHEKLEVSLDEGGGLDFPDFLYYEQIPLVSDALYRFFSDSGVDNLFYKPIYLNDEIIGVRKRYWLALPPRIRCLNYEASQFRDSDVPLKRAEKIVINPAKVGNYRIFCIEEVINRDIIITQELKEKLEKAQFTNLLVEIMED